MIHSTIGKLIKNGLVVLLLLLSVTQPTIGQVFPVQANISITPPYTVYLSNYTSPQQQRVMVNILLHDPVTTSVDVRFKFSIEGGGIQLYTNPNWMPQPYTLTSGIPILLTSDIIAEYFQPQHLVVEGINPQEFFRNGKMPEGFYRFKVEVLQYQRGVTISNTAQTGVWLLLNEAPRMVFPTPNQKVLATNPQMLNFSWVPGGITSPLSAQTTMYEFTMVEVQNGMDPTIAITTTSDAVKFTSTTQQTSLLYGPSEPQLIPGKQYAIRVRAYNTDGYEIFKNNGYSDVRVFQFGDACNPPVSFTLGDETQSTFSIDVITSPGNSSWIAQFRENSDDVDEDTNPDSWSELKPETGTTDKTVKGLKASTTYQVQVKATCGGYTSDFLPMQTVTTAEKVNANRSCDSSIPIIDIPNALPLQELKAKDVFFASLFPIVVSEVTQQGNGKFSGKGVVTMPLFNTGLAVSFTDVGINEVYQLTSGEVEAVRYEMFANLFGDDLPLTGGSGTGTGTGGLDSTGTWPPFTDTISIDVPFDSVIVVNDSTIWVVPTGGGEPIVVDLGGSTCTLITPPDGNMDNAQVVYNGAAKSYRSGNNNNGNNEQNFTGFYAKFIPSPNQQYGFDSLKNNLTQQYGKYYKHLSINGKEQYIPWKALAAGISEPVNLTVKRSSDSYDFKNIKVTQLGVGDLTPSSGKGTNSQTFMLSGSYKGMEEPVVVTYSENGETHNAGGIYLATYGIETYTLYIVPFPDINIPKNTIGQLQNGLNQIYSQAVVSWNVKPMDGFVGIDLGDNGLDWAQSDMLSSYDSEMNSVISAFKDWKENPDPDAYYLFVVPKFSESNLEGFMPRNRRFGFITADQLNARTVAHELGHGAFNLRHTFPEATQGSTDNLMDYPPSEALADKYTLLLKAQWDLIHNPEATTGLFDDMGDGALYIKDGDDIWSNNLNSIACAVYKNETSIQLEGIVGGLIVPRFKFHDIDGLRVEIPNVLNISKTDKIDLQSLKVEEKQDYTELSYQFVGKIDKIYFKIPKDKANQVVSIISQPKGEYFRDLVNSIPEEEGQEAYKKLIQLPICSYIQIPVAERIKYLGWLAGELLLNKDQEEIVVNLLTYIKEDDKKAVAEFFNKNPSIFDDLYRKTDNYKTDLMQALLGIYLSVKSDSKYSEIVAYSRIGYSNEMSLSGKTTSTIGKTDVNEDGIKFLEEVTTADGSMYNNLISVINTYSNELFHGRVFDCIHTKFYGYNDLKGVELNLPAFYLKYIVDNSYHEKCMAELRAYTNYSLMVLSGAQFVSGISTSIAASKSIQNFARIVLGSLDLSSLTLGTYCNDNTSEFCQDWKKVELFVNLGLISAAAINELVPGLLSKLNRNKHLLPLEQQNEFNTIFEDVDKIDNLAKGADEVSNLFASARQSAIAKFGKEAEDLIYIKFNKDGGAAAEILDHYGTDGLNALKKSSTIDDAAKELVKDKTLYRAVNESTYNFDKLKNQGIIDASPSQYPTYISLDHYTDANIIKSKLQLPKKPTWVAEFDGNQILNDVSIPKGKYLNADYKEVLCRSYPNLGEGGGSQFITNSEIKVKRLINLETGEIINFTH